MGRTAKKSTKKFEKKHLRDTLERRKEFAKLKQRRQLREKKKAKNAAKRAEEEEAKQANGVETSERENAFAEMNVDDFFAGGFNFPDSLSAQKKQSSKKGVAPTTGKRKRSRDDDDEDDAEDASSVSSEGEKSESASESVHDSDPESGEGESDSDDVDAHRGQLEALKEKDPEFYKYLEENDAELLEFGANGDFSEVDELSEGEEDQSDTRKKKKKKTTAEDDTTSGSGALQLSVVKQWQKSMLEQNSLRATRQAVLAFRCAASVDAETDQELRYNISDPDVYHQVLITALQYVPKVLNHHLPVKETASGKVRVVLDSKKFRTLVPLIKSHMSSVHKLLENLSDAATLKLTLSSMEPILPYLLQFRKLLKVLIKAVASHWSDSSNTEATRITAFLILRRLMVIGDSGIRETVLKTTYEGLIKGSRNTSSHTIAGVNLMKNSAAELWGIDQNVSYTTGFNFVRQLAIHLRSSIIKPTKDSYKTLYNWQYVHSLDFWSRVLSMHCDSLVEAKAGKESALRPLIYPVVQITLGAMRLIPTAQYFPLRFQLTRALLRLSLSTGTYIPVASALLEVLNSAEMRKPPKPSTLKPLDFTTCIRAPKSYLRTRVYQDGVGEEVAELLSEFLVLWTKNIAFPELSLPVVVMLKRWLKDVSGRSTGNKNGKVNQMFVLLVQKVESNSRWIEERRSKVAFSPKDRAEVEGFLKDVEWEATPLGAFVKTQRAQRAEKAKLIERSRKEERSRRKDEDSDVSMADASEDEVEEESSDKDD
ncbi:hypothetical protein VTO42DRAFT_5939 [Malbranchea cinnamomea]